MIVTVGTMRPMDIDPTFVPYLEEAMAGCPRPLHEENTVERRARVAERRRRAAPPVPGDVRVETVTVPAPGRGIEMRFYRPAAGRGVLPVIFYVHGGGWMYGSPEQSEGTCVRFCQETGAAVVAPRYRLSPEHPFPAGFEDCYAALRWVAEEGHGLGLDGTRMAVSGESSGGNLCAALAIEARDRGGPAIRLQVLNYPALGTDFETGSYRENAAAPILSRDEMIYFWRAYLGGDMGTRDPRAVPLAAADLCGLPPPRIVTAEYDPLRDDGIRYAGRLKDAGVPVEFVNARHLTHGFMRAWPVSDGVKDLAEGMCRAFRDAFGEADGERVSA